MQAMVFQPKTWASALLLLSALVAPTEPPLTPAALQKAEQNRALEAARVRAEQQQERRLQCLTETHELTSAMASRKAECEREVQHFNECRAQRPPLEGAELWGCGLGLAMGVASGLASEPWNFGECGVAEAPESRMECPVPACTSEPRDIEREVLAEHGLTSLPSC